MIYSYETNFDLPSTETKLTVPPTQESIQDLIVNSLSQSLNLKPEDISLDLEFAEHGVDSVVMLELVQILEDALGRSLDLELLRSYPTPRLVAQHLFSHQTNL